MITNCPVHKDEKLRQLYYHEMDKKIWKERKIKRGTSRLTKYHFCPKCDKSYQIKVTIL